jgi:hypothetical protein
MAATARQCGGVRGPRTQFQRARSRLMEPRPIRCLRRSRFGRGEYNGIATISELILMSSPVWTSKKRRHQGLSPHAAR